MRGESYLWIFRGIVGSGDFRGGEARPAMINERTRPLQKLDILASLKKGREERSANLRREERGRIESASCQQPFSRSEKRPSPYQRELGEDFHCCPGGKRLGVGWLWTKGRLQSCRQGSNVFRTEMTRRPVEGENNA